jgi:kynureninase
MNSIRTDVEYALELDSQDQLAHFRERFVIAEPDLIYLLGNSLGRLPQRTMDHMQAVVEEQWGHRLIRAWNDGWFDLPERVGGKMARLLGAKAEEVIMADSTSVNLFKAAMAALQLRPSRRKIVTDDLNFPSDHYILQGVCQLAGPDCRLHVVPSPDGLNGSPESLAEAVDGDTALVALSHTSFKSGYVYDMASVTDLAHEAGALMLWDVSHSVGAMPLELDRCGVDLAVGCSYKYLNGGPGGPAFIFANRHLHDRLSNPVSGWMGQNNPFEFSLGYEPAPGMRRFLTGTPPILSLAAIEAGLDLIFEAGIDRIREKSIRQTEYLIGLWERLLAPIGFRLKTPRQPGRRGSHVTLGHDEGLRIDRYLVEQMQVLTDFRPPDNIRLGVAPLYNSFTDIHAAVTRMQRVVEDALYLDYQLQSTVVT